MIGHIDGFYVAAQVRLVRQVHKGTIFILEGETDARVFDRFIDSRFCDIEVAFGKSNVLTALDLLEDEGFAGVVALIDADFDRLFGTTYSVENVCVTDMHDLDLTIFSSSALDRYIAEYGDAELLRTEFKSDLHEVRQRVVTASLPLAYCRLASECRNLRLYFKELKHDQFVRTDNLLMALDDLVEELILRSTTPCSIINLKHYIIVEEARMHDPYQLASGHDVAAILGIALRKLLASRRTVQTWASEVEAGLRLAFDWEAMVGTALYGCLKEWEVNNKPFRIFRQQPN